MRSTLVILLALVAGTLYTSCDDGKPRDPAIQSDSVGEIAPATRTPAQEQPAATDTAGPIITNRAVITTDLGDITLGLYGFDAPMAVQNFIGLAQKEYYNGIGFHRIAPGFVVQVGDPKTKDQSLFEEWGSGGESIYGDTFEDELDKNSPSGKIGYVTGTVAMANRGPNTNSSQFFIVLTTQGAGHLPYSYTIFGRVLEGMDVVKAIEKAAVDDRGNPVVNPTDPVRITNVTVQEVKPSIQ